MIFTLRCYTSFLLLYDFMSNAVLESLVSSMDDYHQRHNFTFSSFDGFVTGSFINSILFNQLILESTTQSTTESQFESQTQTQSQIGIHMEGWKEVQSEMNSEIQLVPETGEVYQNIL